MYASLLMSAPDSPFPLRAIALGLLVAAGAALSASLLWDYAWESTVGIDRVWAPPHALTYLAVALAALGALASSRCRENEVRLAGLGMPLGGWLALWGALAYVLIGGVGAGTVLTLLFLPALYALWFKVKKPAAQVSDA